MSPATMPAVSAGSPKTIDRALSSSSVASAGAQAGRQQQAGRGRHYGQAEQPVARPAAPEEIGADDEPDEQVQRAGPGAPREAVGPSGLDHEQCSLREPAESHAPRREPSCSAR